MNASMERRIAVVLDDVAAAAAPLAWSQSLARTLRRELRVVYVERTSVLEAAALPITQTLAHAGAQWARFEPADIERAYRLQLARLQELMQRLGLQQALRSLQVVRGALQHAALDVDGESDLVLVSAAALLPGTPPLGRLRCHSLMVWSDDSEQGLRLVEFATRCAQSLGATQRIVHTTGPLDPGEIERARADLLMLPRERASARVLAAARRPLLLVGRKD